MSWKDDEEVFLKSEKREELLEHLKAGGEIMNMNSNTIFIYDFKNDKVVHHANSMVSTPLTKDIWEKVL